MSKQGSEGLLPWVRVAFRVRGFRAPRDSRHTSSVGVFLD